MMAKQDPSIIILKELAYRLFLTFLISLTVEDNTTVQSSPYSLAWDSVYLTQYRMRPVSPVRATIAMQLYVIG